MAVANPGKTLLGFVMLVFFGGIVFAIADDYLNPPTPQTPQQKTAHDDQVDVFQAFFAAGCGVITSAQADTFFSHAVYNVRKGISGGASPQSMVDDLQTNKEGGLQYAQAIGCSQWDRYPELATLIRGEAVVNEGLMQEFSSTGTEDHPAQVAGPPPTVQSQQADPATTPDPTVAPRANSESPAAQADVAAPADQPKSEPQTVATDATSNKGHWYYCDALNTYYPYVQRCPVPWRPVTPEAAPDKALSGSDSGTGAPAPSSAGAPQ